MFERDKSNNEIKSFDIDQSTNATKEADGNVTNKPKSKKTLIIGIAIVALIGGGGLVYSKFYSNHGNSTQSVDDKTTLFVPMDEITVNLKQGVENNTAWLKVRVTLEVLGKANNDTVTKMMPKITDIFQTYLKELRKNDLDGSFGIYKIKDEMLLRINAILYPAKIEAILFQDFMMQVV